jgi:outer membrane receptor protein involved in Fe transport
VDAGTNVQVGASRDHQQHRRVRAEQLQLLDTRLTVTLGLRGDQSSLNGDAKKLYIFPKAAASYRFEGLGPFSELKFRAAWGQSGNEPLYGQKFTPLTANLNINGLPGLVNGGVTGAADLGPERQAEVELGADGVLFNGGLNFEATVYEKRISELLLTRTLPPSSGLVNEIFNGGRLRTRGIELAAGVAPIQTANLNWLFRVTYSSNRSEITEAAGAGVRNGGFGTQLGAFFIEEGSRRRRSWVTTRSPTEAQSSESSAMQSGFPHGLPE